MAEKTDHTSTDDAASVDTILVGIDFSQDSEAALLWADMQASCMSARIVVLHVVHDPAESPGFYRRDDQSERLYPMESVAEDMMKDFIQRMIEEHPECKNFRSIKTRLVSGLPAGRIVEIAQEENAMIIIIGSRGLTGLPHLLLGSTANRVAQLSTRPVMIVKHHELSA
jgi:nucleotide-binding universal stress UspA family protein